MSFSYGLAVYMLVLMGAFRWTRRLLGDAVLHRLRGLQGIFVAGVLYFVMVYHLTNLYVAKHHGVERFILLDGGIQTLLFWFGQVLLGGVLPLLILLHPRLGKSRAQIALAAALVILGGLAQMYVTIIGGQAYPLALFPGQQQSSSFYDGVVHGYVPSLPEVLLGLGGVAVAGIIVVFAVKLLCLLPENLEDRLVEALSGARPESQSA
jgi:Ni/Fe-hydrogenase subunit HybB-like protein